MGLILKLAAWLPAIAAALAISMFSGQDGNESQGMSDAVAGIIVDAADYLGFIDADGAVRNEYIAKLSYPVRKAAHMTEYAIFTCCVVFGFYVWGRRGTALYIYALTVTFVYASSDEMHQLFVPERSGQFTDVLIDTAGGIIAVLVIILVRRIVNERKITKKPV